LSAGEQFQHPAPNIPIFKLTAQTACAVLFGPVALFGPCLPLPLSAGATCSQYQLSGVDRLQSFKNSLQPFI
jgi:hypothetical protein